MLKITTPRSDWLALDEERTRMRKERCSVLLALRCLLNSAQTCEEKLVILDAVTRMLLVDLSSEPHMGRLCPKRRWGIPGKKAGPFVPQDIRVTMIDTVAALK